jgi:hypothetical protein
MALTDIVFENGETNGFINEIPYNAHNGILSDIIFSATIAEMPYNEYNGVLSDINSEGNYSRGLISELKKSTVIIDNRRKVR